MKRVAHGDPRFLATNPRDPLVNESPEETIFRAFVISATGARISCLSDDSLKLSVLKSTPQISNTTIEVAFGSRFFHLKLSDSPFNILLLVNSRVAFGIAFTDADRNNPQPQGRHLYTASNFCVQTPRVAAVRSR